MLIKDVEGKGAEKLVELSGQEKKFSISCAVVQSVIDYTEQCVGHSADDQIINMQAEIQDRIEIHWPQDNFSREAKARWS